ncbi:MarR family winged helix-turn-helix transcriptional regulator [Actinomyces massiliensis]|mgnify:FL=1|uniref:MarR family winged helix-turn-helix transcriptional regulator n=1 Tax=Actinomyces massiliensis TaxID=461393 RepID=UPI0002E61C9C|nr:MarR family transcriptional regulator [Actinomyces massiliensis]
MNTTRTGLHERLRRLHRLMRRRHVATHAHAGPLADTTRGRGRVLAALKMQSPIPTRELAYLLDIRQQSLNELLKKLQADGLIERAPSETDRRIMMVALTEAGRAVEIGREDADYLDALTDEEVETLVGLLDKLINALEAELGVDGDDDLFDWMAEARRRMGDEPFEAMMRMREQGFGSGPFGGGRGRGGRGEHSGRGGRSGRSGHGGPGGHDRRGGRRGPWSDDFGPGFPGDDAPEPEGRRFRRHRGGAAPSEGEAFPGRSRGGRRC